MRETTAIVMLLCILMGMAFMGCKKELSDFSLRADGIGPVSIGLTPKEVSAKLGLPFIDEPLLNEEEQACIYLSPKGYSEDIAFMVEDGHITRIDIISSRIASIMGIRVGDHEEAVKKAFPNKVKEEPHPYLEEDGKYLIVEPTPGYGFVFETDMGRITAFRSGKIPSVLYIEGCL